MLNFPGESSEQIWLQDYLDSYFFLLTLFSLPFLIIFE